jgi:uncharacterized protein YdhG (YjbR/CyaY superfamily)
MPVKAENFEQYLEQVPEERKEVMNQLRKTINDHLPKGFSETIGYGMPSWVVPHSLYPAGYHCDTKLPLPFLSIASQKNFISVYHMGIYADQTLMDWFLKRFGELSTVKPDIGKSCIRFKKPEQIPFQLIAELCEKMTPQDWIGCYEEAFRGK